VSLPTELAQARARLEAADSVDPAEQVVAFGDVHALLQDALARIDAVSSPGEPGG
jgi:hypothetical protein